MVQSRRLPPAPVRDNPLLNRRGVKLVKIHRPHPMVVGTTGWEIAPMRIVRMPSEADEKGTMEENYASEAGSVQNLPSRLCIPFPCVLVMMYVNERNIKKHIKGIIVVVDIHFLTAR